MCGGDVEMLQLVSIVVDFFRVSQTEFPFFSVMMIPLAPSEKINTKRT